MTEQPKNPLMAARGTAVARMERGSDLALGQLADHCQRLNSMALNWWWEVRGTAPDRYVHRLR